MNIDLLHIVTFFFCLIILVSFGFLLYKGDNDVKSLQKIIGGFAVFIVSLIAQKPYVFVIALLIGGLIIASENFMRFLAAVLKSSGDKVPDLVNAWNTNTATSDEVEQKVVQETVEAEIALQNTPKDAGEQKQSSIVSHRELGEKVKLSEQLVGDFFSSAFGVKYQKNVKLTKVINQVFSPTPLILDGAIMEGDEVQHIFEIRHLHSLSIALPRIIAKRFVERIRMNSISAPITMAFVSEAMSAEFAKRIKVSIPGFYKLELIFFKLEGEIVIPILPEE